MLEIIMTHSDYVDPEERIAAALERIARETGKSDSKSDGLLSAIFEAVSRQATAVERQASAAEKQAEASVAANAAYRMKCEAETALIEEERARRKRFDEDAASA
ncbi:MAG: hypothetical protein Q8M16_09895 [Pirellulaceae bacterium]|nr:hypothetical protein [Pirellulaceae bacterium]